MLRLSKTLLLAVLLLSLTACAGDPGVGLVIAAGNGDTNDVLVLLVAGADVNDRNNDGMTALIAAAVEGYTETAQALLDAGVGVEGAGRAREKPACGYRPASIISSTTVSRVPVTAC